MQKRKGEAREVQKVKRKKSIRKGEWKRKRPKKGLRNEGGWVEKVDREEKCKRMIAWHLPLPHLIPGCGVTWKNMLVVAIPSPLPFPLPFLCSLLIHSPCKLRRFLQLSLLPWHCLSSITSVVVLSSSKKSTSRPLHLILVVAISYPFVPPLFSKSLTTFRLLRLIHIQVVHLLMYLFLTLFLLFFYNGCSKRSKIPSSYSFTRSPTM